MIELGQAEILIKVRCFGCGRQWQYPQRKQAGLRVTLVKLGWKKKMPSVTRSEGPQWYCPRCLTWTPETAAAFLAKRDADLPARFDELVEAATAARRGLNKAIEEVMDEREID